SAREAPDAGSTPCRTPVRALVQSCLWWAQGSLSASNSPFLRPLRAETPGFLPDRGSLAVRVGPGPPVAYRGRWWVPFRYGGRVNGAGGVLSVRGRPFCARALRFLSRRALSCPGVIKIGRAHV